MARSLWLEEFVSLMVRPDSEETDQSYCVIKALQDSVKENDLVRKAYFFLPTCEEVYLYSGAHLPLSELGDKEAIENYLDIREANRDPEETSRWKVFLYNRRIFIASDFCLPNFVGVLFSVYITRSVYEPITRLMRITSDPGRRLRSPAIK